MERRQTMKAEKKADSFWWNIKK